MPDLRARILELRDLVGESPEMTAVLAELEATHEQLRVAAEEIRTQEQEIQRLLASQRLVRWQQDRVRQLLPVAVVTTDLRGTVDGANAAALRLLGVELVQLVRTDLLRSFSAQDGATLRAALAGLAQGDRLRRTATVVGRGGRATAVEVSATVASPGAREISWVLIARPQAGSDRSTDRLGVSEALVELAALPASALEDLDLLRRAVAVCQQALGDRVAVSVIVGSPTAPSGLASSASTAQVVDGAQLASEDGPSVLAFQDRRTVVSGDIRSDPRWPRLAADPRVPELGAVAVPLAVGDVLLGVLCVYGDLGDPPHEQIVHSADLLGASMTAILHEAKVREDLERESAELEAALLSRATIDQAKGIVMAERGCSVQEAFDHLVELSSTQHVKLRDVARMLVEQRSTGSISAG